MKIGMNLSSLLSIVKDFISFSFLRTNSIRIGMTNVVTNTIARLMSALRKDILNMPEFMNTNSIHVGNKAGCVITDMNFANLSIS